MIIEYDVIIVGLGPTGGTLANLLGLNGLSVLILEKESAIYNLPRAVHFDDEIMRVFNSIGIKFHAIVLAHCILSFITSPCCPVNNKDNLLSLKVLNA